MFDEVEEPLDPTGNRLLALLRSRVVLGLIGLALLAVLGLGLSAFFAERQMRSSVCEVTPHEPMSMDELISVKRRLDDYIRSPTTGLDLNDEELSMLLEARTKVPMRVDLQDDTVVARVAVPASEGCYNVQFHGAIAVADGVAAVTPDRLEVGSLNVSWLARGLSFDLYPEHMPSEEAAALLRGTRGMEFRDGRAHVDLFDPRRLTHRR